MKELIPTETADTCKGKDKISYLSKFNDSFVSITDTFEEETPILQQGDRTILSKGNILALVAQAKSFKSYLTYSLIAAALEGEQLTITGNASKVLLIDTEQSRSHVHRGLKRIYRLCGYNFDEVKENIKVLALREYAAEERFDIVKNITKEFAPDLLVVDNIKDLLNDMNSIPESQSVIQLLMTLSSTLNLGVIAVLHLNKSIKGAPSTLRGHVGSFLQEKAMTVLQITKTNDIGSVTSSFSRNQDIEEFSFRIGESGLPILCEAPKIEKKTQEIEKIMTEAFIGTSWIDKATLIGRVSRITKKSERTAYEKIKVAIDTKVISLNNSNMYILCTDTKSEQENMYF